MSVEKETRDNTHVSFFKGDKLKVRAYHERRGGLYYDGMDEIIASEDGFTGGWDVWDGTWSGLEVSFYGFSVERVSLPPFKPMDSGTCQGCESQETERQERAGEMLCRSCWLLNAHMAREPGCAGCETGACPYKDGSATE